MIWRLHKPFIDTVVPHKQANSVLDGTLNPNSFIAAQFAIEINFIIILETTGDPAQYF